MSDYRKFVVRLVFLAVMVVGVILYFASGASADGPPGPEEPVAVDPCFQQDPECYHPEVECANNVFVPRHPDGTWFCPNEQGQLPEEVIGRAVTCSDGQLGYIVDVRGSVDCPPPVETMAEPYVDDTPFAQNPLLYGAAGILLTLLTVGTLYMIFRKTGP